MKQALAESRAAWQGLCSLLSCTSGATALGAARGPLLREARATFQASAGSKSSLSSLNLRNRVLAFGEINLKGKTYFRLQHTLKPKSARPKATCLQTHPPGATSAIKPEAELQSTCLPTVPRRGWLHKVRASKTGCRVNFGSPPGGQLPMACLQITRFLKTE